MFRRKSLSCILLTILLLLASVGSASAANIGSRFSEGVVRIKQNEKWGYMNKTGEIVIAPKWDAAADFKNGYAIVQNKGSARDKYTGISLSDHYLYFAFVIDKSGKVIFTAPAVSRTLTWFSKYTYTLSHSSSLEWTVDANGNDVILVRKPTEWAMTSSGYIKVKTTVEQGYFYPETGEFIEFPDPEKYKYSNGVGIYEKRNIKNQLYYGLISFDGKPVTEAVYKRIESVGDVFIVTNSTGKQGIIDGKGSLIVDCQYNIEVQVFNEVYISGEFTILMLSQGGKIGAVHPTGKILTDARYDELDFATTLGYIVCYGQNSDSHDTYILSPDGEVTVWNEMFAFPLKGDKYLFSTNLNAYYDDGPYGVLDVNKNIVVAPRNFQYFDNSTYKLSSLKAISDAFGIAFVKDPEYMNPKGTTYISYYEPDKEISLGDCWLESIAYPFISTGKGTFDSTGTKTTLQGHVIDFYSDDLFIWWDSGKYGLVNSRQEIILPFEYTYYGRLYEGVSIWEKGDEWYLVDEDGNVIF